MKYRDPDEYFGKELKVYDNTEDSKADLSAGLSTADVQDRWELWLKTNPEVCGATVNYRWIRQAFFDAAEGT
jgi:hypothetical protein